MAPAVQPRGRQEALVRGARHKGLPAGQLVQFRRHPGTFRGRHDPGGRNARKAVEAVGNRHLRHLDPQRAGVLQRPAARCHVGHEGHQPAHPGRLFLGREDRRGRRPELRRGRFALDRRGVQHRNVGIRHRHPPAGLRTGRDAALLPAGARRRGGGRTAFGRHTAAGQYRAPALAAHRRYVLAGGFRPARPPAAARGGRRYAGHEARRGRHGVDAFSFRPNLCRRGLGAVRNDARRRQFLGADETHGQHGRNSGSREYPKAVQRTTRHRIGQRLRTPPGTSHRRSGSPTWR